MKLFLSYPSDRGVRAIFLISLMQSMIAMSLIEGCFPLFLEKSEMEALLKQIVLLISFVVLGFFFFNFLNYQGKYSEFDQNWKNETKSRKTIKGLLIIISLLIPFAVYAYVTSWVYQFVR
jgi:magnesium-transporting ATPase (P-type)